MLVGLAGIAVAGLGMLSITRTPADAGLVNVSKKDDEPGL